MDYLEHTAGPTTAVIYCRVSDPKQVTAGDGLGSQEARCREFAEYKGYKILSVYKDDISGEAINRPKMNEMLAFLKRSHNSGPHAVIIDDISRLARGLETHFKLKLKIRNVGGILVSPSVKFGSSPDEILVENMLASMAQHQREKNREQTLNRMRGRLLNGRWVFDCPVGLRYAKVPGEPGKILVADEPNFSIVTEALEGFAFGRFATPAEVKRFLERHPTFPKDRRTGLIHPQRVSDLLRQVLYAGYLVYPKWSVSLRKAQHPALINYQTFEKIQARLKSAAKAPARKDISSDFPLRGFIICSDCGKYLSSCWSEGKSQKYPYYFCKTAGCPSHRKSIRRADLEGDFGSLLQQLEPTAELFEVANAMFEDAWNARLARAAEDRKSLLDTVAQVEKQIETMLDRIVDSDNATVISAYEKRIANLQREKATAEGQLQESPKPKQTLEESFEHSLRFLASPWQQWQNTDLPGRRTILRLSFNKPVAYSRIGGLRTPDLAFPFKLLGQTQASKEGVARPAGLEPATVRLEGGCSIQLSYGRPKAVSARAAHAILSVGPVAASGIGEIVGIGLGMDLPLVRLLHHVGEAVLLGEGHRFVLALERDAHLVGGVAGRDPAHQGLGNPAALGPVLQHPLLGLGAAGLHRRLRGFEDSHHHAGLSTCPILVPYPVAPQFPGGRPSGPPVPPIGGGEMVGVDGFEPPALCSQSRCATRLRYTPKIV